MGQDSEKKSLADKVPQTLHSNEFMELFFISRKSFDFWTKISALSNLIKIDVCFYSE